MKKKFLALCMALGLLLLGVGCAGNSANTIRIGSKPMAEQYILTEMMKLLIEEHSDLKVDITKDLTTSNLMPAMESGELDLYPEYTGTGWKLVLKKSEKLDSQSMFEELNREYKETYQMEWLNLYGFGNAYAIAIPTEYATTNHIKTMSDLAPLTDQLVFGAESDFFEREDGYNAMTAAYGYHFKGKVEMNIGLRYNALQENQVQVINVFTSEGQLINPELTILEDDRLFYTSYDCGTIIREETLERHPELREILAKMTGLITEKEMQQMNHEVEANDRDEKEVAREFLVQKGLLQ